MNKKNTLALLCCLFLTAIIVAQNKKVTVSGIVQENNQPLAYVNILLKTADNSVFVLGTVTSETFSYISTDYKETQVLRLGYHYKF
ncbi:hypothetical protein ACFLRU_04090 [Bacteroidota bacterium]